MIDQEKGNPIIYQTNNVLYLKLDFDFFFAIKVE